MWLLARKLQKIATYGSSLAASLLPVSLLFPISFYTISIFKISY
uniref:Uncharacterized protein n=1 Tax=Arundo donax TaxID=35708 RepID=A0A0A9AXF6_ARUDO